MVANRLARLLRPRSLVFVGGEAAELAIDACRLLGFSGDMWAVNPRRPLRGLPTFASVGELPAGPDSAFVGVGSRATVEVVGQLAAAGTGVAVCHASGFAETGETGAALQAQLLQAAAGMPLLGPNCYGTLSAVTGAALWPDVHGLVRCDRGVALLSQSGNIAVNLTMQRRGLDVAHVMALGNQADVGVAEAFEAMAADEAVTGVGLVIEAVDDVDRFAAAARSARERKLPVAVLKLGASTSAGAIAVTHTASLVGEDAAYDALFRRAGIQRVRSVPELLDTLAVRTVVGPLKGNRLVSLSCSGGEAALVADRARGLDLAFPQFAPDHRRRVEAALDGRVAVTNPLDYHTFIWGDRSRLEECFATVLGVGSATADGITAFDAGSASSAGTAAFDAALLVLDFPAPGVDRSRWWPTLEAFGAACGAAATPGVVAASMAENLPEEARARAAAMGVAACGDIDTALSAIAAAAVLGRPLAPSSGSSSPSRPPALPERSGSCRPSAPSSASSSASSSSSWSGGEARALVGARPHPEQPRTYVRPMTAPTGPAVLCEHEAKSRLAQEQAVVPPGGPHVLCEHEAKSRLAAAGIAVPGARLVAAEEAAAAAGEIGYPVVVKAIGTAHKTDTGGVVIGLDDPAAVAAAAGRLAVDGNGAVLVESCVTGAVAELLVSVRSAPPVGMLLTVGAGGTLVDLLDDTASVLLPASAGNVREALASLRVWPLLCGHRGRPGADVDSVVDTIMALDRLVCDDPSIVEVEINPLLASPSSAVAVDALMVVAPAPADAERS